MLFQIAKAWIITSHENKYLRWFTKVGANTGYKAIFEGKIRTGVALDERRKQNSYRNFGFCALWLVWFQYTKAMNKRAGSSVESKYGPALCSFMEKTE